VSIPSLAPKPEVSSGKFVMFDVDPRDGDEPGGIEPQVPAPLPLSPSVEEMGSFIPNM
jgi:hypothetical protein